MNSSRASQAKADTPLSSGISESADTEEISFEVLAILAGAVVATFGRNARIAQVKKYDPIVPAGEFLLQQWSIEGRRQIYSSHKIR